MGQLLVRPKRMRAAVTTEAEARASVGPHRPDLLVCSDWLESGCVVSLVREARQEVPGMGVLMLLSHQGRGLRAADPRSLDQLVDGMVHEDDLNADEAPLGAAFIALCLGQRYRSPSLLAREWPPPAAWEPQGVRLTPREEEGRCWAGWRGAGKIGRSPRPWASVTKPSATMSRRCAASWAAAAGWRPPGGTGPLEGGLVPPTRSTKNQSGSVTGSLSARLGQEKLHETRAALPKPPTP